MKTGGEAVPLKAASVELSTTFPDGFTQRPVGPVSIEKSADARTKMRTSVYPIKFALLYLAGTHRSISRDDYGLCVMRQPKHDHERLL